MVRTYISINLPEEFYEEIKKTQNKLPKFEGKKTNIEHFHLTLKFLGEISEEKVEEVKKKLREIKFNKFNLTFGSLGVFDETFIRVIWIGSSDCDELQKEIDNKLFPIFKKEKKFDCHLTLARVKKIKDKRIFLQDLKNIKIPKIKFNVNEFFLMKSIPITQGYKHEIFEKYNLI